MKVRPVTLTLLLFCVLWSGLYSVIRPGPTYAAPIFVRRSGTLFTLDGQPFNVAGVNNHYLSWASQAEVDNVLNDAAAMHFNVVRVFMGPVIGSPDGTAVPTIWHWKTPVDSSNMNTHGVYDLYWDPANNRAAWNDGADGLQRMDYVIAKAGSLHLKLLIPFLDFWEFTGGAQQISAWYQSTDRYHFFFVDQRTRQVYKDWVQHILNRVNPLTGIAYKDDPTIFAWDLMNEPQTDSVTLMYDWLTEMAAYVKSIDPNHLLGAGIEGFYGGQAGNDPYNDLLIPDIDFNTWHVYPANRKISPGAINPLINMQCATATRAGKPVLMEEFGYGAQNADRADFLKQWTDTIYGNANCAGWLYWRLTSKQDNGSYPADTHDQYDIHNDGSPAAQLLSSAAVKFQARTAAAGAADLRPLSTPTALPGIPVNENSGSANAADSAALLVPAGEPGQTYFAAYPKTIHLNGDLSEWRGIPEVRVTTGPHVSKNPAEDGTIAFAAAADDHNLYLLFRVVDSNIIGGKHNRDWGNEDSIEFYINATGNLSLHDYQPGVADLIIPAQNLGRPAGEPIITNQPTLDAGVQSYVFRTTTGYGAEAAVPLQNNIWQLKPVHGGALGFQVQLNGASQLNRDTQLLWSTNPNTGATKHDPSVFGKLIFYRIGAPKIDSVVALNGVTK